jgi:hypothetical protein
MNTFSIKSRISAIIILALLASTAAVAKDAPKNAAKDNDKDKPRSQETVDSGTFGVFMNGHRVGTETFSIVQDNTGSVIKSEFKTENDPKGADAVQSSELQLTPGGEIRRYDWKELSPEKASSVIVPNDQLLSQKWSTGTSKEHVQPYILPPSTSILDDYFFIHREILVWKFLGTACKQDNGAVQCPIKQRTQFGTLDPRQHNSAPLAAEYLGREKISYKGTQQDFNKIQLEMESGDWQLWLDDHFKLVRIRIDSDSTDVVRD